MLAGVSLAAVVLYVVVLLVRVVAGLAKRVPASNM